MRGQRTENREQRTENEGQRKNSPLISDLSPLTSHLSSLNSRLYLLFIICYLILTACATLDIVKDRIQSPVVVGNKVTFYYDSVSAKSVSVAGEFNGWEFRTEQRRSLIMKKNKDGVWQVSAEIPHGRYQYKIVVDYQTWLIDPYNPSAVDDGTGNINSLLVVK